MHAGVQEVKQSHRLAGRRVGERVRPFFLACTRFIRSYTSGNTSLRLRMACSGASGGGCVGVWRGDSERRPGSHCSSAEHQARSAAPGVQRQCGGAGAQRSSARLEQVEGVLPPRPLLQVGEGPGDQEAQLAGAGLPALALAQHAAEQLEAVLQQGGRSGGASGASYIRMKLVHTYNKHKNTGPLGVN